MLDVDAIAATENHGGLDRVSQFANVAGPRVAEQHGLRLVGETDDRFPAAKFGKELLGQVNDVFRPIAQRQGRSICTTLMR